MNTIEVEPILTDAEIDALEGNFLDESYLKYPVINEDTIVKNEKGETLLVFLKNKIPANICYDAYKVFRIAALQVTSNRSQAAGPLPPELKIGDKVDGMTVGKISGNRFYPVKKDGTISNSGKSKEVNSGIVGYADRYPRIPYCRTTEFTRRHFDDYKKTLPYIKYIADLFKKYIPERYEPQKRAWEKTHEDFRIPESPFTTITVNKNFRTACHYDAGDLKEGFGNLGVLQAGEYSGAYTIIPKYGVGVDVRSCDVSFFNVHELHGNTAIKPIGNAERISIIAYFREKMTECGSAADELERVKYAT
tara:strand:- start:11716 stop:12633 length:918 start_codon:yes stop_codon:yes gene_type:complete